MNLSAQTKNKLDPRNIIIIACAAVFAVYWLFNFRVFRIPHSGVADCLFIYSATLLPLAAIFAVAAKSLGKSKRLAAVAVLLGASYVLRVLFADFESGDYAILTSWVAEYKTLSVKDCFIKQVGNYPPLYNYFLILFSRLPLSDLYLIKTLSFYFEITTAVFAVKLVALVRKENFSFVILGIFLILPVFLANSSQWAQCDAQYTMCAVAAVYFALKHKSVPCYVFIGLGLAFKMQFLLVLPAGLVILLSKDQSGKPYLLWRWIWLAPVVFFAASGLPALFGGSFFKVIKVYLNQSTAGNAVHNINGMCANLSLPFYHVPKGTPAYYALLALFLCLTAAADSLIIVYALRVCQRTLSAQQAVFLCALLPLVSVFFMPKMLDRFYYLAETFLAVYLSVKRDKDMLAAFCLLETGQWLVYMRAFTPEKFFIMKNAFIVAPLFIAFSLFFAARRYFTEFARTQPNESSEIDKTA